MHAPLDSDENVRRVTEQADIRRHGGYRDCTVDAVDMFGT